jgi:hypothetical protein
VSLIRCTGGEYRGVKYGAQCTSDRVAIKFYIVTPIAPVKPPSIAPDDHQRGPSARCGAGRRPIRLPNSEGRTSPRCAP